MSSHRDPGPPQPATPMTFTARSPEDLLALAPVVLGFFPAASVVMLTFGAVNAFHARVDLPRDPAEVAEIAELLVDPARRHGVERVVLLVYSDDRTMSGRLWRALEEGLSSAGIGVVEALRVEEERWFPLLVADPLADTHGVDFDISTHPFLVRAVVEGRVTHGSRDALAGTLAPDEDAAARMALLVAARQPPLDLLQEGTWLEETLLEHLDAGEVPSDEELARALVALDDLRLRDAAWSVLTREHSRAAVAWWTHALTRCPPSRSPAPAALLAWSAWLNGNGALAWCALDRCTAVAPAYGLGRIVADLLDRAQPPSSWNGSLDWRSALEESSRAG